VNVKFESKGGFNNTLKWFDKASNILQPAMIKNIQNYGEAVLRNGTPEDTGETALGWESDITVNKNSLEVAWKNTAHPESEVNVARIIELGHGTRTGGYVAPRPYIKQSMAPVWQKLDNDIKELMK
jgi:hypothetical protein